jgi:hypothetical protein
MPADLFCFSRRDREGVGMNTLNILTIAVWVLVAVAFTFQVIQAARRDRKK